MYTLGFMQGRLSPQINGKIQAFPVDHWQQEFVLAHEHGWHVMEWTLDQENLEKNPLMTVDGRTLIRQLIQKYDVIVPSLTGDFIMQAPFYKSNGKAKTDLLDQFRQVLMAAAEIGIQHIVVPLVDGGSLTTQKEQENLREGLSALEEVLHANRQVIVFESDFNPTKLYDFISIFRESLFGINYDSGNSASLGYDIAEEFEAYGSYIKNVHIKDRPYQGTTVPLGQGDVDFEYLFERLALVNYTGNLIFQTARAQKDNHASVLNDYRCFIQRMVTNELELKGL